MQIALIQLQIQPSEKQANYDSISRLVDLAVTQQPKPDLIVLPELWSTGYALAELKTIASDEGNEEVEFLGNLARKYGIWFAGGS
ncbi:MAG: carbon-nitrogen family hydrolase, partial [Desulfobacterales bacterium]|nr:carbon-nitrogen family hydrolase [Desulfobacterales bacterium]